MDEPLSKEQLQAIRERSRLVIAAREREAEAHKHMLHNPSAVRTFHALQDIRIEAEEDLKYHADEDIPALLAHIDALEAEIGALREAILNLGGDPDQAWFWTDRWQQLEREAQEDIDAGRVEDASDFLA